MLVIWPNLAIFRWIRYFLEKERNFSLSIDRSWLQKLYLVVNKCSSAQKIQATAVLRLFAGR
jgi:hypothetical protein